MKRVLSLCLALMMTLSLCACGGGGGSSGRWEATQRPDEFGDISENSPAIISSTVEGTYSGLETTSGDLIVNIKFQPISLKPLYVAEFELLEEGERKAVYSNNPVLKCKIGDTISSYDLVGAPPNENLYLSLVEEMDDSDFDGNVLFCALYSGTDVPCIISMGSAEYHFTLKSSNFEKACDDAGFVVGPVSFADEAKSMTVRAAVEAFVTDDVENLRLAQERILLYVAENAPATTEELISMVNGVFLQIHDTESIAELYGGVGVNIPDVVSFNPNMYCTPNWWVGRYTSNTECVMGTYMSPFQINDTFVWGKIKNYDEESINELWSIIDPLTTMLEPRKFDAYENSEPENISIEDNMIIQKPDEYFSDYTFYDQLIKITDDIYIVNHSETKYGNDPDFYYYGLWIRCPKNYESILIDGTSPDELVNYICTQLLPEIE